MRKTSPKENCECLRGGGRDGAAGMGGGGKEPYCSCLIVSCDEQMCVSGRVHEKKEKKKTLKEIVKKQNNNSYFQVLLFLASFFLQSF